jgi:hypothetical protein
MNVVNPKSCQDHHFEKHVKGKLMMVGNVTRGQPTFLTMPRGGRSSCCTTWDMCPRSKMASVIKLLGHGTKWYVHCNNSGGVILVHNHYNQCAWDCTDATSTKMGWLNQPWSPMPSKPIAVNHLKDGHSQKINEWLLLNGL